MKARVTGIRGFLGSHLGLVWLFGFLTGVSVGEVVMFLFVHYGWTLP